MDTLGMLIFLLGFIGFAYGLISIIFPFKNTPINSRKKGAILLFVGFAIMIIGVVISPPIETTPNKSNQTNQTKLNESATSINDDFDKDNLRIISDYANKSPPYDKLPDIPLIANCDLAKDSELKKMCITDYAQIIKAWNDGWKGDYQGQRNIAYSLSYYDNESLSRLEQKPDGGLIFGQTKIQGCAWRIVILKFGHLKYETGDDANLKIECGRLDETQRLAADAIAKSILSKIKGQK